MPRWRRLDRFYSGRLGGDLRRGAGAVERAGLENRSTRKCIVGSNPTLSAKNSVPSCPIDFVTPYPVRRCGDCHVRRGLNRPQNIWGQNWGHAVAPPGFAFMSRIDNAIRHAKCGITPSGKVRTKFRKLGDTRGLYLEVSPAGGQGWRFKHRFMGRQNRLSIGVYSKMGLNEVCMKCEDARRILGGGRDPSVERQAERLRAKAAAEYPFEFVAWEWHDVGTGESPRSPDSPARARREPCAVRARR